MSDTYRIRNSETWDKARADYLAGDTAEAVCRCYDLAERTFKQQARDGGWRRRDQPAPPPRPDVVDDGRPLDLGAGADKLIRRAMLLAEDGQVTEAARAFRLGRDFRRMVRDDERERKADSAREVDAITGSLKALEVVAKAQAAQSNAEADTVEGLVAKLKAVRHPVPALSAKPNLHNLHLDFPPATPASPADLERLIAARDKAFRRGQHGRGEELQAKLTALAGAP